MKVKLLIYQQKVRKNRVEQWDFYKAKIIETLKDTFANYQKDEELLRFWLTAYAQTFPDFVVLSFVAPSLARTMSKCKSWIVNMGGVEEGIETTMEVDSNVTKVSIESTQVAPNTTQVVIETMHPYTLSTIVETKEGTKNFNQKMALELL
jgi:hypothetical protein